MELCSNNDISSESESDGAAEAVVCEVEKEKRHYILNSGRKKGLANRTVRIHFKQSSNLRYHMKTRHPTEEDLKRKELLPKDRLECEECKKSFHSQYTLKYHKLRVHADDKKFECKICGRRVAKQFMLDSHMLVHSDQKLACKFCGREFVRKYQVEAHIKAVHQKLKPFQCSHCSESFASRKTLRHHVYIHTGEKPRHTPCSEFALVYLDGKPGLPHQYDPIRLIDNESATGSGAEIGFQYHEL
ncbi:Zinc finger protein 454 [Eumeta japonica]|uniref:Zinc finger protein 454 n=1 Tax=Eumeta variegata TaxID=151549 RepID=A0A4C1SGV7_EUMVA|nr:Zinc finger protein 454 [Eumeta japonica]